MKHILLTAFATSLLVAAQAAFAHPDETASVSQRDVALGEVNPNPSSGMSVTVDTAVSNPCRVEITVF